MRLGEEKLYARYTNLKDKQREEEEALMSKMMLASSTDQATKPKP